MMKDIYASNNWNLLSDKDWLRISKPLMHQIGDRETIMLCELVSLDHYHRKNPKFNGWFRAPSNLLFKHTAQSPIVQKRTLDSLVEKGLILRRLRGVPASNHFLIAHAKLNSIINMGYPQEKQQIKHTEGSQPELITQEHHQFNEIIETSFYESQKLYNKDYLNNDYSLIGIQRCENTADECTSLDTTSEQAPKATKYKRSIPIPKSQGYLLMKQSPDKRIGFHKLLTMVNGVIPTSWAKDMAILNIMVNDDHIEVERIRSVINWLKDHWQDDFVPSFSSSERFRYKFFDIEKAMARANRTSNGNNNGKGGKRYFEAKLPDGVSLNDYIQYDREFEKYANQ